MLWHYLPAFRIALFWSIFAFLICFVNLCYRLESRATQISLLPHGLTLEAYLGENQFPDYFECNGIWSCSRELCIIRNLANLSSLGILISPGWDEKCDFKGLSFIWQWKMARISIIMLSLATFFQLLALFSGVREKNYRVLCFVKRTVYSFLALTTFLFLLLAYLFEFLWTQSYNSQSFEIQPFADQVWYFILTALALINFVHANYGVVIYFRFDYQELS
jgi:hypothetical protein